MTVVGCLRGVKPLFQFFPRSFDTWLCPKCHSEERSDERVPAAPRPFAALRVTWIKHFWGKVLTPRKERGTKGVRYNLDSGFRRNDNKGMGNA